MLTMSTFGNNGRLGNQLFQYAAMIGIASARSDKLVLPPWKYSGFFEGKYPEGKIEGEAIQNHEAFFHFDPLWIIGGREDQTPFDIKGYFQSEKYFEHCADEVKKVLKFKKSFVVQCLEQFPHAFEKETIAIHIRRGDYIDNKNYANLPITYYISALEEHFSDWKNMNLIIFSDDIEYAKVHFGCLSNAFFSQRNPAIDDLCLMSHCDHFIIANSSYSWWAAWLGEKRSSKIVRPVDHFECGLKARSDIKDLYPERWIAHKGSKIDLKDVTFTIPVLFDHLDRKKNLDLCVCMLQHNFETSIIVGEQGMNKFEYMGSHCAYMHFVNMDNFHRTKMLNEMAKVCQTPIIANWDADVVIAPMQILETVKKIRDGADMVYPYEWMFARIPRQEWFSKLEKAVDIGIVGGTRFMGMRDGDAVSFGGAVLFNKESFIKGGMENEHFISFGPEDSERRDRFTTLGFKVVRTNGPLYHINHWVGPNSSKNHEFFEANRVEYLKVAHMKKYMIEDYIKNWKWVPATI